MWPLDCRLHCCELLPGTHVVSCTQKNQHEQRDQSCGRNLLSQHQQSAPSHVRSPHTATNLPRVTTSRRVDTQVGTNVHQGAARKAASSAPDKPQHRRLVRPHTCTRAASATQLAQTRLHTVRMHTHLHCWYGSDAEHGVRYSSFCGLFVLTFTSFHVCVGREGSHAATTATLSAVPAPRVVFAGVYTATRRACTPRGSWLMLIASALPSTAHRLPNTRQEHESRR